MKEVLRQASGLLIFLMLLASVVLLGCHPQIHGFFFIKPLILKMCRDAMIGTLQLSQLLFFISFLTCHSFALLNPKPPSIFLRQNFRKQKKQFDFNDFEPVEKKHCQSSYPKMVQPFCIQQNQPYRSCVFLGRLGIRRFKKKEPITKRMKLTTAKREEDNYEISDLEAFFSRGSKVEVFGDFLTT